MDNGPMHDALTDRTADLLCLSDVKRWNIVKTQRDQSVAEHSFAVAVISMEIVQRLAFGAIGSCNAAQVMWWALVHDMPEVYTSDIDGKFKRDNPHLRQEVIEAEAKAFPEWHKMAAELPLPVRGIVKLADKIEAISWIRQWGIGSRADDVKRELYYILYTDLLPKAAVMIGMSEEVVELVVRQVLNQSTSDSNCIQNRRHRVSPVVG